MNNIDLKIKLEINIVLKYLWFQHEFHVEFYTKFFSVNVIVIMEFANVFIDIQWDWGRWYLIFVGGWNECSWPGYARWRSTSRRESCNLEQRSRPKKSGKQWGSLFAYEVSLYMYIFLFFSTCASYRSLMHQQWNCFTTGSIPLKLCTDSSTMNTFVCYLKQS